MPRRGERDCYSSLQPCSTRCRGSAAAERRFGARAGPVINAEPSRSAINKNSGECCDPENHDWNACDHDTGRAERVRNS